MLGLLVQTAIMSIYDKGPNHFNENFALFITRGLKVVLAPINDEVLPDNFKAQFTKAMADLDKNIQVVYAAHSNFEGISDEEAQEIMSEEFRGVVESLPDFLVSANRALVEIIAEDTGMDTEEGRDFIGVVSSLSHVNNFVIQFKDKTFMKVPKAGSYEAPAEAPAKLQTGRPDRDTIISDDDLCNLKIALGSANTVEEFLAML